MRKFVSVRDVVSIHGRRGFSAGLTKESIARENGATKLGSDLFLGSAHSEGVRPGVGRIVSIHASNPLFAQLLKKGYSEERADQLLSASDEDDVKRLMSLGMTRIQAEMFLVEYLMRKTGEPWSRILWWKTESPDSQFEIVKDDDLTPPGEIPIEQEE